MWPFDDFGRAKKSFTIVLHTIALKLLFESEMFWLEKFSVVSTEEPKSERNENQWKSKSWSANLRDQSGNLLRKSFPVREAFTESAANWMDTALQFEESLAILFTNLIELNKITFCAQTFAVSSQRWQRISLNAMPNCCLKLENLFY